MADGGRQDTIKLAVNPQPGSDYRGPARRRRLRRKRVTARFYAILVGLVVLIALVCWGRAFWQIVRLERQIAAVKTEITIMRQKNADLADELQRLNSDSYVEEMARENLGMVKEGETAYSVVKPVEPDDPFQVPRRAGVDTTLYQ